uniref:Putative C31G5.21 protein n=1 Tax=Volvariella volvacea TaxID=36659 RepID=H6VLD5_9AGAR|nr:putative C31G5.21 protein [Volvariella volvacea]
MSEYTLHTGGSLKLKGGVVDGGIVKKKKKKSKPKTDEDKEKEKERLKQILLEEKVTSASPPPGSNGRNSPAVPASSSRKTEAEKRFEEVQRRRLAQRVAKLAGKTHKDRVAEFNAHLESLSEHHDIPKVGPG